MVAIRPNALGRIGRKLIGFAEAAKTQWPDWPENKQTLNKNHHCLRMNSSILVIKITTNILKISPALPRPIQLYRAASAIG